MEKTMTKLANAIGRVMMTAVRLPRSPYEHYSMQTYVKTEFRKSDQAYVYDCMINGKPIDYRNIF